MSPPVSFTDRQTEHVRLILQTMVEESERRPHVLPIFLQIKMRLMRDMIDDGIGFDETDFESLALVLELYLASFDEDDIDALAEQAYAKAAGHWFILPPWYDRMKGREWMLGEHRRRRPSIGT